MYICMHICSRVYSFHVCYIQFGAYPNHMHIQIIVKNNLLGKKQKRKKQQHRLGTNVRVRGFDAGLLTRSQFASGRS
jgi:hypothetical protein